MAGGQIAGLLGTGRDDRGVSAQRREVTASSLQLSGALLRNQGLAGAARYVSGLTGPARRGKRLVEEALAAGRFTDELPECKWSKVIAAGSTVAASITTPSGRGVLFVDLDARGREITDVSVVWNEK